MPSIKAERWRYLTVKECREALEVGLSSVDPRARVKKGFKSNMDNLVGTLKTELGGIVDLSAADLQLIGRLSLKTVTTWLEYAMHRCRIVVCLTGSDAKSSTGKIRLLQEGTLSLTVLPKIGRHGNVNGVELERWSVIAGCAGDSLTIP